MANCYMDSSAATWVYFDEIHVLLKDSMSADFLNSTWKWFRKYNAYATGITQDIQDYLANPIANALLSNSEFVIMLRQTKSLDALESLYGLSNPQLEFLRNASEGHGIIKMGNSVLPFTNLEPKDSDVYQLITTKPGERKKQEWFCIKKRRAEARLRVNGSLVLPDIVCRNKLDTFKFKILKNFRLTFAF